MTDAMDKGKLLNITAYVSGISACKALLLALARRAK